jgi:ferredoxin-NADP reductase
MVLPPTGVFLPVYEPGKHLICMAGGSGVTPFRGFVREAQQRQLTTRITVMYSVRTPDEIIFRKDFEALAAAYPQFKFLVTCTRAAENDGWTGRRGRITLDWLKEQIGDLAHAVFYACGSNEMVDGLKSMVLNDLKAEKHQMKTEKWG